MNTRLKLGMILIFFEVISYVAFQIAPRDDTYYLVAGAFSFLIMPVIASTEKNQVTIDLLALALLVLIVQFFGYLSYHLEITVSIYNNSIHFLLVLQFLRLMLKRRGDGVAKHSNFVRLFRHIDSKRNTNLC